MTREGLKSSKGFMKINSKKQESSIIRFLVKNSSKHLHRAVSQGGVEDIQFPFKARGRDRRHSNAKGAEMSKLRQTVKSFDTDVV